MTEKLNERIRELMLENGLNGEKLAKCVDVSIPAVSQWLNGTNEITLDHLFKLAKLFNCSVDFLVCRTNNDIGFQEKEVHFLDRLNFLLNENKVSLYKLNQKGILPKSTYYTWLKGTSPRLSNIIPIADFFDCSIDYFLGCRN